MKIFTRFFLAVVLLAVYITGYGATIAMDLKGEGVSVPKSSAIAQTNENNLLAISCFVSAFDFATLNRGLAKTIKMPEKYAYNFTANASKEQVLGLQMINTSVVADEGKTKPTFSAFPNPTRGLVEIKLGQPQTGKESYKITLSNTIGQVVKTIKVPESANNSEIKVDLSTYPAGIYFYSLLINDKMVETKRLVLQQ